MDTEIFAVALKNIRHQRIRSFLTLAGVIIGVAAIVALISVGNGLQSAVTGQFEKIGLNTVFVEPGSGDMLSTVVSKTLSDRDITIIEGIPGVEAVIPLYETSATVTYREESTGAILIGFDPQQNELLEKIGYMDIIEGRKLDPNDRYSVIVGKNFVEKAYSKEIGVHTYIEMKGKKFRIIGILDESGMSMGGISVGNMFFMHKDVMKEVFNETRPTELGVITTSQDDVDRVVERIEYLLENDHGVKDFYVMSTQQILEGANSVMGIIQLVLVGIAGISLLVGGIGIMNTMFMAIMERTREIGVMKAIGATNRRIMDMFLLEAGMIGAVGGVLGSLVGFVFSFIISYAATFAGLDLPTEISPILFVEAVLFAMIVGMIAGYVPAKRASQLDPVEALHYE